MNGEFEQARALYRRGRAMLRELGQGVIAASTGIDIARVELLAGDLAAAEREIMRRLRVPEACGETYYLSTMAALLSRVVRDQGRDEEALDFHGSPRQRRRPTTSTRRRSWQLDPRADPRPRRRLVEAESLARSAVELSITDRCTAALRPTHCRTCRGT